MRRFLFGYDVNVARYMWQQVVATTHASNVVHTPKCGFQAGTWTHNQGVTAYLNDEFVTQRLHKNAAFRSTVLYELLERGGSCLGEYVAMHCGR